MSARCALPGLPIFRIASRPDGVAASAMQPHRWRWTANHLSLCDNAECMPADPPV
jgi:hypothetical protein